MRILYRPLGVFSGALHVYTGGTQIMRIDMTLATSYEPVLVCFFKITIVLLFYYSAENTLYIIEKHVIVAAFLFIDNWAGYEYIINTNGAAAFIAGSVFIHDLRNTGIQERDYDHLAHNITLAMLLLSNMLVLLFGETSFFPQCLCRACGCLGYSAAQVLPTTADSTGKGSAASGSGTGAATTGAADSHAATAASFNLSDAIGSVRNMFSTVHRKMAMVVERRIATGGGDAYAHMKHRERLQYQSHVLGSFVSLLISCVLFVALSTFAMPGQKDANFVTHFTQSIRVWSFVLLSLVWNYTVNHDALSYDKVAAFTPCILRFSSCLFMLSLNSVLACSGGLFALLAMKFLLSPMPAADQSAVLAQPLVSQPQHPQQQPQQPQQYPPHTNRFDRDRVVVVSTAPPPHAPHAGVETTKSTVKKGAGSGGTDAVHGSDIDYNSLFQQAMSENGSAAPAVAKTGDAGTVKLI